MDIHSIVIFSKIFIWIIAALRNLNNEILYFFIALAFIDPVIFIIKSVVVISSNFFYMPLNMILYLALRPSYKSIFVLTGGIIVMYFYTFSTTTINLSIMLVNIFIAGLIIRHAFTDFVRHQHISLYYPVLFIFSVINIVKVWYYIFDEPNGLIHFFIFNAIQTVIGVFFICFSNKNCPRYSLVRVLD